jgi:glycosyltransferase involved in cell wall biosynthesis
MANILLLFTNDYPFGKDETFIENEMPILAKAFDKIVVISNDCTNNQTRQIPINATIERYSYFLNKLNLFISLTGLFSTSFWAEMKIIKTIYKKNYSFIIIKTILQTLQKAKVFNKNIDCIIAKHASADDRLFAYSYWADDTAFALTLLKKNHQNIKTFCRAHRWDVYFEENRSQYLPFRLALLENLDAVFVISEHGKTYIETLFSKTFQNLKISRLGVPEHAISPFDYDHFTIVSISNIIPVKNLETLVNALSLLTFKFKWIHIGDGAHRSNLERYANNKIPGNYQLLGMMPNNEVITFLEQTPISLFINVSLSEGIPVAIMEALSCSIPVIATNVGGNGEIVTNRNGILIDDRSDEKTICNAITSIRNASFQESLELRQNALRSWNYGYNAEINYNQFVEAVFSL